MPRFLLFAALLSLSCTPPRPADAAPIHWYTFDNGRAEAAARGRPAMVVMAKSWCEACQRLMPQIDDDEEIRRLAENFVMIRCGDSCETDREGFSPDGKYFPRIFFTDASMNVAEEFFNFGAKPEARFFYASTNQWIETMERVLDSRASHGEL